MLVNLIDLIKEIRILSDIPLSVLLIPSHHPSVHHTLTSHASTKNRHHPPCQPPTMGQQRPTLIGVALLIPLLFTSLVSSTLAAFQIPSRKSQQHCFKSYSYQYHPATATAITAAGAGKPSSDVLRRRLPTLRMGSVSSSSSSTQVSESTKDTFKNKSILLTGASRGLGKSLAHALSNCSPSLLILSGRDEEALKKVQQTCIELGAANVEIAVCDLANKQSVQNLATTSLQLASDNNNTIINILINNGGISSRSSFLETTLDVDEQLMQVNFFSGASLAKALVPGMVKNNGDGGGKVIWISSIQGKCKLVVLSFDCIYTLCATRELLYVINEAYYLTCIYIYMHTFFCTVLIRIIFSTKWERHFEQVTQRRNSQCRDTARLCDRR